MRSFLPRTHDPSRYICGHVVFQGPFCLTRERHLMPSNNKTDEILVDITPAESDETATSEATKPRRGRRRTERAPRKRTIALPVLVVDETVLLPHMSIPYPIDDDESAMVIERGLRTPLRQVLVLTERLVNPGSNGTSPQDEFRALLSDMTAAYELEVEEPHPDRRTSLRNLEAGFRRCRRRQRLRALPGWRDCRSRPAHQPAGRRSTLFCRA